MATNKVNQYINGASALTITLASLGSSTTGAGQQATEVDLSGLTASDAYPYEVTVFYKLTQGTSPTGNRAAYFYVLASDGTHRDGGAGASDATFTVPSNIIGSPVHVAANASSPSTGDVLRGSFSFIVTSKRFVLAMYHDTGVALNSTAGNHYIQYSVRKPDVQAAA